MIAFEPISRLEEVLRKQSTDEYHFDEILSLEPEAYLRTEHMVFAILDDGEKEIMWDLLAAATVHSTQTDSLHHAVVDDCHLVLYDANEYVVIIVQTAQLEYAESLLNSFV